MLYQEKTGNPGVHFMKVQFSPKGFSVNFLHLNFGPIFIQKLQTNEYLTILEYILGFWY
jgi:hypothetical protein